MMCVDGGDGCFWSVSVWYERCGCKRDACKSDLNLTQTSVCLHLRSFCHLSTSLKRQTHSFLCLRGCARVPFVYLVKDKTKYLSFLSENEANKLQWAARQL